MKREEKRVVRGTGERKGSRSRDGGARSDYSARGLLGATANQHRRPSICGTAASKRLRRHGPRAGRISGSTGNDQRLPEIEL